MNRQLNEQGSPDLAQDEPTNRGVQNRTLSSQSRYLLVAWILLLLLGALFLFGALSDLLADARAGLLTTWTPSVRLRA